MTSPSHLGRYEINEILGRGSMGVVYKAHDPLIERAVALKTISYAGLTPTEAQDFEQRFFLEAKSAGRLSHPNIVTIHDIGHSDELAYIAMEFLPGQSLRTILDSGVVLPPKRIARYACSVANGLAFAHTNGVVHRDIKPANIMVLDTGLVKIADFGIALLPNGALTIAGTAVGSPKYMSPEQVLGQKADARSDIFSLGAVLYEMLTGTAPFTGADLNAILYQVLNGAPPLPSDVNASLPQGFDRIVARALAKDPDKRYQNATEMAADLRNYKRLPGLLHSSSHTLPAVTTAKTVVRKAAPANSAASASLGRRLALIIPALALLLSGAYLWRNQSSSTALSTATASPAAAPVRVAAISIAPPPAVKPTLQEQASTAAPQQIAAVSDKSTSPAATPSIPKPKKAKLVQKESDHKPTHQIAPPISEEEKPPVMDWKTQLRAELAACEPKSFFPRISCKENARWQHCPGHWGSIEECPRSAHGQQ